MQQKAKVGVLFCGGCNSYFDRWEFYSSLKNKFADKCEFQLYNADDGESFDITVLINGCQSECLLDAKYVGKFLLVDSSNYTIATGQFEELLFSLQKEGYHEQTIFTGKNWNT